MPLIRPFAGLRPVAARADEVLAPPYDVLSSEEARVRAQGRPWSFLHISKAEIDLPPGTDPHDAAVYLKARENFDRARREGVLIRDSAPCYYLYRLTRGAHVQTGVVAAASVADYLAGRIRRHEFTRPDKEDDRVHQIDALDAQTGPVLLTCRHTAALDALLGQMARGAAEVDVTADDGVRHQLWVVRDAPALDEISAVIEAIGRLYIADGHHRSAAAARVADARAQANPAHRGTESYNYFLAVIFPDNQMQILDYNRAVRDLNGLTPESFLARLQRSFRVVEEPEPVRPVRPGQFGMILAGKWFRLAIHPELVPAGDPVLRLDVSLLQNQILAPILGIGDPRRDRRIEFIGGIRGLGHLERRVAAGEMAVAFSMYPTSIGDMMAVADTGEVMPPKSTWFEPKLADGLVSHLIGSDAS